MSLAAEIIEYMGGLVLSGGDHDGRLLEVLPWERQFVRGVFSRTGDAAISCARGNGKTLVVAAIASAVVDPSGPLHGNRREVICVASSFAQSKIIFEDVLAFLGERFDLDDRSRWRKQDSQNAALLEFRASGARIRCIGADPRKMHSLRPYLAVVDEPAQHNPAQTDRMLAAIRTGLGKTPGSRLIALGTRSHDSGHWFSRMLESADYSQVHAMRPDGSPFTLKQIRRANPSYDHLPSLAKRIQAEIRDARVDPDARAAWVALRGNGGQSDVDRSVLVDSATWSRAESLPEADRSGGYVLGLDVSSTQSMTCAVAYFRSGRVECFGMFPEHPDLRTRGLQDGVGGAVSDDAEAGRVADPRATGGGHRRVALGVSGPLGCSPGDGDGPVERSFCETGCRQGEVPTVGDRHPRAGVPRSGKRHQRSAEGDLGRSRPARRVPTAS